MRWLRRLFPLTLAVLLVLVFSEPLIPEANAQSEGDISFMPNVIPELEIHFVEEFFRFEWLNHTFDLKLLIAYEEKLLSLRDFWEKTDRLMKWQNMCRRATESMYEFGYRVEDIPQPIADEVDYLIWKIEGASFDVSEIETQVYPQPEGYNITEFRLPDNLWLSYRDLWLHDFRVTHPSNDVARVEGVKGKTAWNLDPITYSTPVITIIGGSEGSELSSQDVYDEVIAQGWNINATNSMNRQFSFNATYCLGNGTVEGTTWFADESTELLLWGPFPRYTKYIEVTDYAHLRFGEVKDSNAKTTEKGVSYFVDNAGGGGLPYYIRQSGSSSTVELYGSIFYGAIYVAQAGGSTTMWNCILHGWLSSGSSWNIYRTSIGTDTNAMSGVGGGTFEDILLFSVSTAYYIRFGTGTITINDLKARNCTQTTLLRDTSIQLYLVNPDVDSWSVNWMGASSDAKVVRQYTFDLTFTFQNGSYAEGTNVTISNTYLGTSDSWILTSNGSIPQQTYLMGHYNQTGGNTLYSYNPYCITATLDGYQTYTTQLNLTQQTNWTITLHEETGLATGFIFGGILTVLIMTVLGLTYIGKK